MRRTCSSIVGILLALSLAQSAKALEVVVDYTYDTQNFFDTQTKREALEAAAARFSRVITSSLQAVEPGDWRIGFTHPGTGESFEISTAASAALDRLSEPADEYGFPGLKTDEWILYAGGHDVTSAGFGGTGTGLNFTSTFDDLDGPQHRGVISNTPAMTANDLPAWGGSVTFNPGVDWHFDLDTPATNSEIDFYSIALHEIGHALGLSTSWNQWSQQRDNDAFVGQHAVAAYNRDNGTSLDRLELGPNGDSHWKDGAYESRIFPLGQPILVGTVGEATQDLLLEPQANFTSNLRRFELTNVDAAALVDIGWSILEAADSPLDINGDTQIDAADVDLACSRQADLSPYFAELDSLVGDLDFDGRVGFPDFLRVANNFGLSGSYSEGDLNCDGSVQFADFLILSTRFGDAVRIAAHPVPEPVGICGYFLALLVGQCRRRSGG